LKTENTKRLFLASLILIGKTVGQSFDDVDGDMPAKTVAAAAWKAGLTECAIPDAPGKAFFFQIVAQENSPKPELHTHILFEFRDATLGPLIEDQPQSLADKLNRQQDGIQWHGHQILKAAAVRGKTFYAPHSGMGHDEAWDKWGANGFVMLIELTKKSNAWKVKIGPVDPADLIAGEWSVVHDVQEIELNRISCDQATLADPFAEYARRLGWRTTDGTPTVLPRQNDAQLPASSNTPRAPITKPRFICPGAILRDDKNQDRPVRTPKQILDMGPMGNYTWVILGWHDDLTGRTRTRVPDRYIILKGQPQESCSSK